MKNLFFGLLLAILVAVLDQISKHFVFIWLDSMNTNMYNIAPFFNFVKVYNTGVSFGMFSDSPYGRIWLSILVIGIICFFLYMLVGSKTKLKTLSIGLIVGGAIGNLVDRILWGAVSDFLDFYINSYHWPAFNLADTTVFIGVVILILEPKIDSQKVINKKQGN